VRVLPLTLLALVAFAANSLLARLALTSTAIDPASFTSVRLVAGAVTLFGIVTLRRGGPSHAGSWPSAVALFVYAAAFSFAYLSLTTGTGALLLFGAVQVTMISVGALRGERLSLRQWCGTLCAFAGLIVLVLPGVSAPPPTAAGLMLIAGAAWGAESLRGRSSGDAIAATAGNFARAVPLTIVLSLLRHGSRSLDVPGVLFAVASGALASGLGYAVWYTALPQLRASTAAVVQLCVPVLAAIAGVALLHEPVTPRLALGGGAVLAGVALAVMRRARAHAVE
jgi:drug/metabolite transporter (DMT)-like permease